VSVSEADGSDPSTSNAPVGTLVPEVKVELAEDDTCDEVGLAVPDEADALGLRSAMRTSTMMGTYSAISSFSSPGAAARTSRSSGILSGQPIPSSQFCSAAS
jgi:hypothetical protein